MGSAERPLRVAIIGSGPAGFYAAEWLFREKNLRVTVDIFERLPAPFGLVRYGVAPDHQRIKRASVAYDRTAAHDGFRFLGNVTVGRDVSAEELRAHYDQVLYTTGSAGDRRLSIPGEDLAGSDAATAFVGWYNGHPDFRKLTFDLSCERAVVVGMGNVALDVARVLVRSTDELAATDIASYALDGLRQSKIREVVLLGRRGPAQAAYDQGELQDIVELAGVSVGVDDAGTLAEPDAEHLDHAARKNVAYLRTLCERPAARAARHVQLRFLVSPIELVGKDGRVSAVRLERNRLVARADGTISARGTGEHELLETGFVLRSIGYQGTAIEGVPFDPGTSTIPNVAGRVMASVGGAIVPFVYAAGWIKRGPTGLIGTNKEDAKETVDAMLADVPSLPSEGKPPAHALDALLAERGVRVVTLADWHALDALELEAGRRLGKVREKFYDPESMLTALERASAAS